MPLARSYDLKDLLAGTQGATLGTAPTSSAHYLGLSIGETDVFNSGAALLASIKASPGTNYLTDIAIGTNATAINKVTQTALIAETYRDLLAIWQYAVPVSAGKSTYLAQIYIPKALGNYHIREVGIFGNAGATLFCRQLLDFDNSINPVDLMITSLLTFN